ERDVLARAVNSDHSEQEPRETLEPVRPLGLPAPLHRPNPVDDPPRRDLVARSTADRGGLPAPVHDAAPTPALAPPDADSLPPAAVVTRARADHMEQVERALLVTPMRRASAPEDIADVIAFLALGTGLMTGQVVVVDGGRTM